MGNLVLSRRRGQRLLIGEAVIEVAEIRDGKVRLAIAAPPEIRILREELLTRFLPHPATQLKPKRTQ